MCRREDQAKHGVACPRACHDFHGCSLRHRRSAFEYRLRHLGLDSPDSYCLLALLFPTRNRHPAGRLAWWVSLIAAGRGPGKVNAPAVGLTIARSFSK